MNPWNIIQKLESDNSRLFKESVIADNINNDTFVWGARLALDPMITFGVQQVPVKKEPTGEGLSNEQFDNLDRDL